MHREAIRARYFKTHLTGFGVRLQSVFLVSCGVLNAISKYLCSRTIKPTSTNGFVDKFGNTLVENI